MASTKFAIHDEDVKRFFREELETAQKQERLREAMLASAEVIRAEAASKAPGPHIVVKLKYVGNRRSQALIGPDKKRWYYQFAETGAQPHEIKPKQARRLAFVGQSGKVFARRVRHTGMAARPFLRPAADSKLDEAAREFGRIMRKGLRS
jgi:hypothetical protein